MRRMLICYYSKGGTTQKMAEKIREGAEESDTEVEVELKSVEEFDLNQLPEYDGLILGSPTYYGLPSKEIKEFLDDSIKHHGDLEDMVGGAFASSANKAGGNETTIIGLLESLLIHGMIVKGLSEGDHYGPVVVGEPGEEELNQCEYYGKKMAELVDEFNG